MNRSVTANVEKPTLWELVAPNRGPLNPICDWSFEDTWYREYAGKTECAENEKETYLFLDWLFRYLGERFMIVRDSYQAILGDACPEYGIYCCPGHPNNSHSGFIQTSLDVNYFTLGESNYTQYGGRDVDIWNED
jgi:hypothetical protein